MNKVLGGLKVVGLSFLLAAAVSVACGREPVAPLPVDTTAASASATAPVSFRHGGHRGYGSRHSSNCSGNDGASNRDPGNRGSDGDNPDDRSG